MYEPGIGSTQEELRNIAAAMQQGESGPLYAVLPGQLLSAGTTGTAAIAGGVLAQSFSGVALQQSYWNFYLPLGWVEGGLVVPQVCWAPADAVAGNVNWGVEYSIISPAGVAATATLTASTATPAVAGQYTITELADIDLAGRPIRSVLHARLYRDGAADSYNNTALLLNFGLRTQVNSVGSVYPDRRA